MSEPVVTYADDFDIHPKPTNVTWPVAAAETKVVAPPAGKNAKKPPTRVAETG